MGPVLQEYGPLGLFRNQETMSSDPGKLLDQARKEGAPAFGKLLQSYRPYLELLARIELGRRLQTKVDPADVVQETFLDAHKSFENFRGAGPSEFAAWLREILAARLAKTVRHFVGTQGRDVRRERDMPFDLDHSSKLLDRGLQSLQSTPSQQAAKRESEFLLAKALAELPEDYREVILLRHFEELSFSDTAARLRRSEDSVQKLWIRALARLKQIVPLQ